MELWMYFVIGAVIGVPIGITVAALFHASGNADDRCSGVKPPTRRPSVILPIKRR